MTFPAGFAGNNQPPDQATEAYGGVVGDGQQGGQRVPDGDVARVGAVQPEDAVAVRNDDVSYGTT
jgi:hypothetical protein